MALKRQRSLSLVEFLPSEGFDSHARSRQARKGLGFRVSLVGFRVEGLGVNQEVVLQAIGMAHSLGHRAHGLMAEHKSAARCR